jgi:putative dehydrogenase
VVLNAEQTDEVLFGASGAAPVLRRGSAVMTCATVPPEHAARTGERLAAMGLLHLDAPISGGAAKAAAGQLTVMASGSPAAFDRCGPLLDAIAATVHRLGDASGQGSKVKMVNQLLAGVHIAAAAEAMALCIRAGADPQATYDVICGSAGSSWMFQNRVPHILAGDYTPLSAVHIFVKDLGIVLDAARKVGMGLPLTAAAHQLFLMAAAAGHGGEDDAAVVKVFPGVDLPRPREA